MNAGPPRRSAAPEVPPLPHPLKQSAMRSFTRFVVKRYFTMEHVGRHHVPKRGAALLISNHPTYIDPWVVAYGTPRWITWVAWEEVFTWPLAGWLIKHMQALPLDTSKPSPSSLKSAIRVLEADRLLGLFYEGGRTLPENERDPGINPPQRGAALVALRTGVPVVPVSIDGARRLWPYGGAPRRGSVIVRYHAPIDPARILPGGARRERERVLLDRVQVAMVSGLKRSRPRA